MGKAKSESRGLAYLSRVRPEAMSHLLKFFGESARHLDPKTRFLISVVTKVINFSPRGLEQYVKRALKEGATPDEVIDAVLCAYPCAGLTKVVDAVDVILDLELPGFEATAPGTALLAEETPAPSRDPASPAATLDASRWVSVASPEEIPPGGALHVHAGAFNLALFNVGGRLLAVDNKGPHRAGPLAHGAVTGTVVTCPLHAWKFNLESGDSVDHPGARVRTYRVRVDNAKVEVLLPS